MTSQQACVTKANNDCLSKAHDALNRMRKAFESGNGCRLSWDELASLNLTSIGECWEQDDPRLEIREK